MAMQLNVSTTIPPAVNTSYVMTRPSGCVPATSSFTTNEIFMDFIDLGTLNPAPKGASFRVTPTAPVNTHCGFAFNCFGSQTVNPQVYGAGVSSWTHANGFFFDGDLTIRAETWHVNPNSSQASGAWLDVHPIGTWVAGHSYQVDVLLYADGHYSFRVLDLGYMLNSSAKPNSNAIEAFTTSNASPNDASVAARIKAKSVNGRTGRIGVFNAGVGSSMVVKPIAIFN